MALAEVKCLTWSNQILFLAKGSDQLATEKAVVRECIDHGYTDETECKNNLHCFDEGNIIFSDQWKEAVYVHIVPIRLYDAYFIVLY